jgi:hypothetical protein
MYSLICIIINKYHVLARFPRRLPCPLEDTSRPAEARDPDELAEAINRLPAEDYRKLRSMLQNDYGLSVPFRRAICCAADAAEAPYGLRGQVPSECGHNPG